MKIRIGTLMQLGIFSALLCATGAHAIVVKTTISNSDAVAHAVKVAENIKDGAKNASVVHYVVPAMSDLQRLPDAYPVDGQVNGELRILAAKDEYGPGSFQLFAFKDFSKVELKLTALKNTDGNIFPPTNLDLTVVKVWYQNGNGWYSYFADPGLKLTPELLLHDENLIKVDTELKGNYAKATFPEGVDYRWISPPLQLDSSSTADNAFNPSLCVFNDAETIQPVALKKGEFKQFFLTAHVEKDCPEGIYRGAINLVSDGREIGSVPVAIRVLPFVLPAPKTYFDLDQDFVVALMGGAFSQKFFEKTTGGDKALAKKQWMALLKNQRRHNILHSKIVKGEPEIIEGMKEAGMSTSLVLGTPSGTFFGKHSGGRHSFDEVMNWRVSAKNDSDYYQNLLGHNNMLLKFADEPPANFVAMSRQILNEYLGYDFMVGTAGHEQIFNKAGYLYRYLPFAGFPEDKIKAEKFNKIGTKGYTGFYAGQHNGAENPQYARRQHGMLSYLSGCSMVDNYEFGFRSWNDLSSGLYKPMNLAYPTTEGVVDTLAWEGFREGIDDMRYATKLMQLAAEAVKSDNVQFKKAGLQAQQYFALLLPEEMDLNELRVAMIEKILKLQELAR